MYTLYLRRHITSADLLRVALAEQGITDYQIAHNKHGKSYLVGNSTAHNSTVSPAADNPSAAATIIANPTDPANLYFNASHSGPLTALALGDHEIGLDLQSLTFRELVLQRAFTPAEQRLVRTSPDPARAFTRIWTMKEAYVKMLGVGLSYGLRCVDTLKMTPKFAIINTDNYCLAIIESDSP